MGVVDKFKEFVAPIDDEGDDILEVEEEVEETSAFPLREAEDEKCEYSEYNEGQDEDGAV